MLIELGGVETSGFGYVEPVIDEFLPRTPLEPQARMIRDGSPAVAAQVKLVEGPEPVDRPGEAALIAA